MMFRKTNLHNVNTLNQVCRGDAENVKEARRLILFSTKGFCPAHLMLDPGDGSCLDLSDVCKYATPLIASMKEWVWKRKPINIEEYSAKMILAEMEEWKCRDIRPRRSDPQNIKELRKMLMRKPSLAIHFFTWEGEPRTKEDIRRAVCLYPTDSTKLVNAIERIALAAGLLAYFSIIWRMLGLQMPRMPRMPQFPQAPNRPPGPPPSPLDLNNLGPPPSPDSVPTFLSLYKRLMALHANP
jgi:hypothetical protein